MRPYLAALSVLVSLMFAAPSYGHNVENVPNHVHRPYVAVPQPPIVTPRPPKMVPVVPYQVQAVPVYRRHYWTPLRNTLFGRYRYGCAGGFCPNH